MQLQVRSDEILSAWKQNIRAKERRREAILAMQMTLDGFAAGPNEEMDWLPLFNRLVAKKR